MRIQPIHPIAPIYMVPPRKRETEEPISFCGHLNRLMAIHRRHMILERLMNFWMNLFRPAPLENTHRLNRLV